jgi:hypothetical protein
MARFREGGVMGVRAVAAAVLLLGAGGARAAEGVEPLLAGAKEKARASEFGAAAALYGDAFALTHREGDLVREQEVRDAFREFLEKLPPAPIVGGEEASSVTTDLRGVRLIVMKRLDPARCGALVSAPCLAGEVLLETVARGGGSGVAEAAEVLGPHAGTARSGLGLRTLGTLARGLVAAAAGEESAATSLKGGLETAAKQEWTDLALAASLELAAFHAKKGDAAAARAAVESMAALLTPKTERRIIQWAVAAAGRRLEGAPPEVRAPLDDAVKALREVMSRGGRGMRGGAGGAGEDPRNPLSPLGLALRRSPKGKVLATVARTKEGFELRVAWDLKYRGLHQRQDHVQALAEGGLTISLADWSVAVGLVDAAGTLPGPPEEHAPAPCAAFYRVAAGETWALTKEGVVQITGK